MHANQPAGCTHRYVRAVAHLRAPPRRGYTGYRRPSGAQSTGVSLGAQPRFYYFDKVLARLQCVTPYMAVRYAAPLSPIYPKPSPVARRAVVEMRRAPAEITQPLPSPGFWGPDGGRTARRAPRAAVPPARQNIGALAPPLEAVCGASESEPRLLSPQSRGVGVRPRGSRRRPPTGPHPLRAVKLPSLRRRGVGRRSGEPATRRDPAHTAAVSRGRAGP